MATKTIGQLTQATTINNADEFAIEQSGVTKRVAASVVRGDIIDANIKSDAAIALSKLATGALPSAITVASANLVDGTIATADVANAAITPAKLSQPYTLATSVTSTSGTSIDFTGIPSWARRVTLMFNGVSTSGSSHVIVQLGTSGGIVSTGYNSTGGFVSSVPSANAGGSTAGFLIFAGGASVTRSGVVSCHLMGGNTWVSAQTLVVTDGVNAIANFGSGAVILSGDLDRVRVTTANGTDTFDAGSINIAYEG